MQDPLKSLRRIPGACVAGEKICQSLDEFIANHENTRGPVQCILQGLPTPGFEEAEVLSALAAVWAALDIRQPAKAVGLQPHY